MTETESDGHYHKLETNENEFDNTSTNSGGKYNGYLVETESLASKSVDERPKKKTGFKVYTMNCCLILLGVLITIGGEFLALQIGWISFPDNGTTLNSPTCYACVGLDPLDGEYASLIDMKVSGIEFKVKTTQIFHGDTMTVDTIVDVIKDPVNIFTPCSCPGVAFSLGAVNCTIHYAYDDCVRNCDSANGIDEEKTVYDPKTDQVESEIIVTVLGIPVEQVAVFTRVTDD